MIKVNPYIKFKDNCEEAFEFYRRVFGGNFSSLNRFEEMPQDPDYILAEEQKQNIMHIALPIDETNILMGCDTFIESPHNNVEIILSGDDTGKCADIFEKLSEGGKVTKAYKKSFWGDYFGTFTDKYGIGWMINCKA